MELSKFIGNRIRIRRRELRLTQTKLALLLNINFRTLQQHEYGNTKVSAVRLYLISKVLDVPIGYFFNEEIKPANKYKKHLDYEKEVEGGYLEKD
jgi:transcriptional regulator with XRE-family HTH domain